MDPRTMDFRKNKVSDNSSSPPSVEGVWEDKDFTFEVACRDVEYRPSQWKRVTDIRRRPVLFTKGTSRFDVGQGEIGTCWFLAMLANLPKHQHIMEKVLKEGDYDREKGVVHCRFWNFGKWEDVYIDDHLAVVNDTEIWGARSVTSENEMWVSFLEKAYAKFNGSYHNIDGNWPSTAYLALAGGIAEEVLLDTHDDPKILFRRIKFALRNEALVTCTVWNARYGLVAPHAYTVVAAKAVTRFDGRRVQLLRVRNPWGRREWTGPWSDGSEEWNYIPEDVIKRKVKDEGEFWICIDDFLMYFYQTTICSLTPDFDKDGHTDSLKNVLNIYGQWLGKTAAGFRDKFNNPKFLLTVPDEEDGTIQLVLQLIQRMKKANDDKVSIGCDLYKVVGKETGSGSRYYLELVDTDVYPYSPELQRVFRYTVDPGQYVVIPSTMHEHLEREFLIRIFAPCSVDDCSEMPEESVVMASDVRAKLCRNPYNLTKCSTYFGVWLPGINDGGSLPSDKFHINPQYQLTVPDQVSGLVPVELHLVLSPKSKGHGRRLHLYFNDTPQFPVGRDFLNTRKVCSEECSRVADNWLNMMYFLMPGKYVVMLSIDNQSGKEDFQLHVKSTVPLTVNGAQTGAD